jgi:excisionase family DNA binding protein
MHGDRAPRMAIQDLPPTISVEEAGEILGVSRRSAYRAAENGELPTLRLGRRLLVPTARLKAMLGLAVDDQLHEAAR